jgi:hypothetical protein
MRIKQPKAKNLLKYLNHASMLILKVANEPGISEATSVVGISAVISALIRSAAINAVAISEAVNAVAISVVVSDKRSNKSGRR